jgi:hypothetical protein
MGTLHEDIIFVVVVILGWDFLNRTVTPKRSIVQSPDYLHDTHQLGQQVE